MKALLALATAMSLSSFARADVKIQDVQFLADPILSAVKTGLCDADSPFYHSLSGHRLTATGQFLAADDGSGVFQISFRDPSGRELTALRSGGERPLYVAESAASQTEPASFETEITLKSICDAQAGKRLSADELQEYLKQLKPDAKSISR